MPNEPKKVLVPNWQEVLLKSWAVWVAAFGLALPELLEFIAANSSMLPLTDEWKGYVRMAALALVIIVRPLNQNLNRERQTP